jgi:hypothetical protein
MSWKPALVGAVVVVLAGLGVGVVTGDSGKTPAKTVVQTVFVPTTTLSTTSTTSTSPPADDPGGPVQYLAEADPVFANIESIENPSLVDIGHASFGNGVVLVNPYVCTDSASVEYVVDSETAKFVGKLGWTPETDSSAATTMEIRAKNADGPLLYRHTFDGPSEPVDARVALEGTVKAIFLFKSGNDESCDVTSTFALGEARFVG